MPIGGGGGGFGFVPSSEASQQQRDRDNTQRRFIRQNKPGRFRRYYGKLYNHYLRQQEPGRVVSADAAAQREQSGLQGIDAQAARSGLEGGAVDLARNSVISERNRNLVQAYMNMIHGANQAAAQHAGVLQGQTAAAIAGQPLPPYAAGVTAYMKDAVSQYLMNAGQYAMNYNGGGGGGGGGYNPYAPSPNGPGVPYSM